MEKQLYSIGQIVSTNNVSCPVNIKNASIIDVYTQNGFVYYVISYRNKQKEYKYTVRQKDLMEAKNK